MNEHGPPGPDTPAAESTPAASPDSAAASLSVRDLRVSFVQDLGIAHAVRGVSFDVPRQRSLGIVGESGCGKSVTALSIMRLIPRPPGDIRGGSILFNGHDLLKLPEHGMRALRGKALSMIFQDPMTSLNPVFSCGSQIEEVLTLHKGMTRDQAREYAVEMLARVGIPSPRQAARSFPHQMSGGMRQRVMIAMALCCEPQLLIADEPTTALDVTVQARILDLLLHLQQSMEMSMIMITHDLGIVADVSHDVLVMYAGEAAENAAVRELFDNPLHPYTRGLLETIPYVDRKRTSLKVIRGEVPNPVRIPEGCPFHPRCDRVMERCRNEHPAVYEPSPGHHVRCFLYA